MHNRDREIAAQLRYLRSRPARLHCDGRGRGGRRLIAGRRDSSEAGMDPSATDTAVAGVKSLPHRANSVCRIRHADGLERGGLGGPPASRRHPGNELMMLHADIATGLEAPRVGVRKS